MQYKQKVFYIDKVKVEGLHLWIASTEKGLALIEFDVEEEEFVKIIEKNFGNVDVIKDPQINKPYKNGIIDYFLGKTTNFTVNLDLYGTEFQKKVWQALMEIPYGVTVSYKDIAIKINNPKAMRAVGMANNKNKIPIIIPCHRVVGADGNLVGYGGGLHIKEQLLQLEGCEIKDKKIVK